MVIITCLLIVSVWQQWDTGSVWLVETPATPRLSPLPPAAATAVPTSLRNFSPESPAIDVVQDGRPQGWAAALKIFLLLQEPSCNGIFPQMCAIRAVCPAPRCHPHPPLPEVTPPGGRGVAASQVAQPIGEWGGCIHVASARFYARPCALSAAWRPRAPFWAAMVDCAGEGDPLPGARCVWGATAGMCAAAGKYLVAGSCKVLGSGGLWRTEWAGGEGAVVSERSRLCVQGSGAGGESPSERERHVLVLRIGFEDLYLWT